MGNCKLGGKHWQRLWDNETVRQSLIEESERLVIDQNEQVIKGIYELYTLLNFTLSSFMHYRGMLKGNATAYSEITAAQKAEQAMEIDESDRLSSDRAIMERLAKEAAEKRNNR